MAARPSQNPGAGSFEDHYEAWSEAVFRYLVHLVGHTPAAEDLFQETWMKALEKIGSLRDPDRFGPWVLRIARNLAYNAGRRTQTRVDAFTDLSFPGDPEAADDPADRFAADAPSPREDAVRLERRRILQQALETLDAETREVLHLRYFEELALAEIASVTGSPIGTVCTRAHRGLRAVRRALERRGHRKLSDL